MRNLTPHPHHMVPTLHHARAAALPGATTWPARARDTAERRSFTATPSSRAAGHCARPQLHLQRQSLRPKHRFACAGATARGAVVGEAGPRCPSPPPIARSASVACRTTLTVGHTPAVESGHRASAAQARRRGQSACGPSPRTARLGRRERSRALVRRWPVSKRASRSAVTLLLLLGRRFSPLARRCARKT